MKKFSLITESNEPDILDDIIDNLLVFYDNFGEPRISESNIGDKKSYIFRWALPGLSSYYQKADNANKYVNIFQHLLDIKTAQKRIKDYDIEFKLVENYIYIRFFPILKSMSDTYKIVVRREFRSLILSYSETIKFFKERNCTIDIKDHTAEYDENSNIEIKTNAIREEKQQWVNLLMDQAGELDFNGDDIQPHIYNGGINIYTDDKRYIEFDEPI